MYRDIIHVKAEKFEGPLDLLLTLIEKRKLYISDISLAKVADDFIKHIENARTESPSSEYPIAHTAHFIFIASTLLLIKSRSLLPTLELTPEEEGNIDELEKRLKLYQVYKDLSRALYEKSIRLRTYPAGEKTISTHALNTPLFAPHPYITKEALFEALERVLLTLPQKYEKKPQAQVHAVIRLEEIIDRLSERITHHLKTSFREFSGHGKAEKIHVVVSFLAVLELVKRGVLAASQEQLFGDIALESQRIETPHY